MKIAVLSDIHANIVALKRVLRDCGRLEVERLFILGDFVGYYYWPAQIFKALEDWKLKDMIQGNHDRMLGEAITSQDRLKKITEKYGSGIEVAIDHLSGNQKKALLLLPEKKVVVVDRLKFLLCHGSPNERDRYIYPDADRSLLEECVPPGFDFIFMGHTHRPFAFHHGQTVVVNPGSVGQPRDIGNLASYLIVDTKNKSAINRRISFNTEPLRKAAATNNPELPYLSEIFLRNTCPRELENEVIR